MVSRWRWSARNASDVEVLGELPSPRHAQGEPKDLLHMLPVKGLELHQDYAPAGPFGRRPRSLARVRLPRQVRAQPEAPARSLESRAEIRVSSVRPRWRVFLATEETPAMHPVRNVLSRVCAQLLSSAFVIGVRQRVGAGADRGAQSGLRPRHRRRARALRPDRWALGVLQRAWRPDRHHRRCGCLLSAFATVINQQRRHASRGFRRPSTISAGSRRGPRLQPPLPRHLSQLRPESVRLARLRAPAAVELSVWLGLQEPSGWHVRRDPAAPGSTDRRQPMASATRSASPRWFTPGLGQKSRTSSIAT